MSIIDESIEPLLDSNENSYPKSERKGRSKLSETIKPKSFYLNIEEFKTNDAKIKKIENKFIFKVYLHLFAQIIFILLMLLLFIKSDTFNYIVCNNSIIFYIIFIIAIITFIYPIISDKILKNLPYNYIYLLIFTFNLGYIICYLLKTVDPILIKIGGILIAIEFVYLCIDSYLSKKKNYDITNAITSTSIFIGLCLLFIGCILYFKERKYFLEIIFIILILVLFGIYLIYDINLIFQEKRRKFQENDYVKATIFLYIDILPTILELFGKFYNSYEPERMPIKKHNPSGSMIYTGDKDYEKRYTQKSEEDKETEDIRKAKRTHSDKGFKMDPSKIIKETENENEEYESNNEDEKEHEQSFKHSGEQKLFFENNHEEEH